MNTNVDINADKPSIGTLLDTQFFQQLHTTDTTQFVFEKNLGHDWESFNSVRKLMPLLYRFRVLNAARKDIRDVRETAQDDLGQSPRGECRELIGEYCVSRYSSLAPLAVSYQV